MIQKSKFYILVIGVLFAASAVVSCNSGDDTSDSPSANADATVASTNGDTSRQAVVADITGTYADTAVTGKAAFTSEGDGRVKLELQLNIPAKAGKEVAVHLHEHGDCSDAGMGAHGHWNPTNEEHGKWGTAHFHRGDIGNVKLDAQGNGTLEMTTDLWQIGGNDSTKNITGKALIVHGGTDDFISQPTGNAGGRIGCAVIE